MEKNIYTVEQQEVIQFKKRKYVRWITRHALVSGDLKRSECCESCGRCAKTEAHHRDYGKPFEVKWLCKQCHGIVHRKGHPDNPENIDQTPLPVCVDKYSSVCITVSIPIDIFLNLDAKSKEKGVKISALVRKELVKAYPCQSQQLQLKFMEEKHDNTQPIKEPRVQNMGQLKIEPQKRNLPRMGGLNDIPKRSRRATQ